MDQNHDNVSPNVPRTPHRTIRVPDDLWAAAMRIAHERGEVLSDVIRDCLREYVAKHGDRG
jgi:hypothetical protein